MPEVFSKGCKITVITYGDTAGAELAAMPDLKSVIKKMKGYAARLVKSRAA